jgi:cytoskeletal protein CcmA (bactofilin family)
MGISEHMAAKDMAKSNRSAHGESVIGSGAVVRGRVQGDGSLVVAGRIEGDVAIAGDLTISEEGTLLSAVEAGDVSIAGSLTGDVNARGTVRMLRGAHVRGDIRGESFALADGAEFVGRLHAEFELPEALREPSERASDRKRR